MSKPAGRRALWRAWKNLECQKHSVTKRYEVPSSRPGGKAEIVVRHYTRYGARRADGLSLKEFVRQQSEPLSLLARDWAEEKRRQRPPRRIRGLR